MLVFIFSKKMDTIPQLSLCNSRSPFKGPTEKFFQDGYAADATPEKWGTVASVGDFRCSEWFFSQGGFTVEKHAACSNRDVRKIFFFWSEERRTSSLALMCVEILVLLVASSDRDIQDGPRADRDGVKWAPYKWPKINGFHWGYFTPINWSHKSEL